MSPGDNILDPEENMSDTGYNIFDPEEIIPGPTCFFGQRRSFVSYVLCFRSYMFLVQHDRVRSL